MKERLENRDPNHILPVGDSKNILHKFEHRTTVIVMLIVMVLLVGGTTYLTNNNSRFSKARECRVIDGLRECKPKEEDPIAAIDPRCAIHPTHPKCSTLDPIDPDPLPPTDTDSTDYAFSGNVTDGNGFTVPAGEIWTFDPTKNTVVEVSANVIVKGVLEMRPNPGIKHTLRFTNIIEENFVGGGSVPIAGDIGLWIVDQGVLDAQGEDKVDWSNNWDANWIGDEIVATPNTSGDYTNFKTITKSSEVPSVNTYGYSAELLNLTRNVNIEGTATGKTHIFIKSELPQTIRNVGIRYVAPAVGDIGDQTGRYGLHFHHNEDGSNGTIVEGVVIRDADGHAFVPHKSNGITFKDTIAYNTKHAAYWWDPSEVLSSGIDNSSNDTVFDHTVAAKVALDVDGAQRDGAYILGHGENNSVINSVVVGTVKSNGNRITGIYGGFDWPPRSATSSVWKFDNNIAHNNGGHGSLIYQNTSQPHLITNFTAYFNDAAGISLGAYINGYKHVGLKLFGNGASAIESKALGKPSREWDTQIWSGIESDGVFHISSHVVEPQTAVRVENCEFSKLTGQEGGQAGWYEFDNCKFGSVDLSKLNPETSIKLNGKVIQKGRFSF